MEWIPLISTIATPIVTLIAVVVTLRVQLNGVKDWLGKVDKRLEQHIQFHLEHGKK